MSSSTSLDQLVEWRESILNYNEIGFKGSSPKSLVLWGDNIRGMALWAAHASPRVRTFEHIRYEFFDEIGDFQSNQCDYVVFYDYYGGLSRGVGGVPYFRQFFKPEKEFVVRPTSGRARRLKWGKPAVLLTHRDPLDDLRPTDAIFLRDHCQVVYIPG